MLYVQTLFSVPYRMVFLNEEEMPGEGWLGENDYTTGRR